MQRVVLEGKMVEPSKVVCVGRNYVEHIKELDNEMPIKPVIFCKPNSAITDSLRVFDDPVRYEAEIVFIAAKEGFVGVGVGLDLTKVKEQEYLKFKGLPWERAKAFDRSAVMSPFVAYSGDGSDLEMKLFIDGGLRQYAAYELMIHKPMVLKQEIDAFMTFEEGDLLMTGTPKGVGGYKKGDRFSVKLIKDGKTILEHQWVAS